MSEAFEAEESPEQQATRLWSALETASGSERAEILLDLGRLANLRDDFEEALSFADSALAAASEVSNDALIGAAHNARGAVLFNQDLFADSAAEHQKAVELFRSGTDLLSLYWSLINAASSNEFAGDLEKALELTDAAVECAREQGDDSRLADSLWRKANLLEGLDRGSEVLELISQVRQARKRNGDIEGVLRADDRASDLLAAEGDYDAAINLLRDCLSVAMGLSNPARVAYFQWSLGRALRMAQRYAEAEGLLDKSLAFYQSTEDVRGAARGNRELSQLHWDQHEHEAAFEKLTLARAMFEVVGEEEAANSCETRRAVWLHTVGKYEQAAALNRYLFEVLTESDRFIAHARLLDNLYCDEQFEAAVALIDLHPGAEFADFEGNSDWFWYQSVKIRILRDAGQIERAQEAMRHSAAKGVVANGSPASKALYYEMYAGTNGTTYDLAKSMALYLEAGNTREARRVGKLFLGQDELNEIEEEHD